MKKIIPFLIILALFTSCTNPFTKKAPIPNKEYTIGDYYPFKENLEMKYAGSGNEFAEQDVYIDFLEGNRIQQRIINPGTTASQVLENSSGELRLIISEGEFYFKKSLMDASNSKPEILLKEPLRVGTRWSLPDGRSRYISSIDTKVNTPSGDYTALEVTTEGDNYKMYDYYSLGIGLIKRVFKSGEATVETSLEKIQRDTPASFNLTIHYPDFDKEEVAYIRINESLKTNEAMIPSFEKLFKDSPHDKLTPLMSKNTKINLMDIDLEKRIAKIDFSREFVEEMNAGAGLELLILQAVANTVSSYYGTTETIITIEGEPYTSGHIQLNINESYKANFNDAYEYKF